MKKTVAELFAGVGGFRCGLNDIRTIEDTKKPEKWQTVWYSQWEPADKRHQWAHDCYKMHFGTCLDKNGVDTTRRDIHTVDKGAIPDMTLLVGGFPCQNYSVASTLKTSKGIEGKKGVLWWDIRDILEKKNPPFVLLENVDRLLKSPANQRGRDFGIMLKCFAELDYCVEWRVINAADYGYQQRRKRTFIFAYKNDTDYALSIPASVPKIITKDGFFAKTFPVKAIDKDENLSMISLQHTIGEVSADFAADLKNSGFMKDGIVYTIKTEPDYNGPHKTLGDILVDSADERYFVPDEKVWYTDHSVTSSDETKEKLSREAHGTWQYMRGSKKLIRKTGTGHTYVYSEGPVALVDEWDKPARTMLTSEGTFARTSHLVRDKKTGHLRTLTPVEAERIQGFPDGWTAQCLEDGKFIDIPDRKRFFLMGNALVVDLIRQMEPVLEEIIDAE